MTWCDYVGHLFCHTHSLSLSRILCTIPYFFRAAIIFGTFLWYKRNALVWKPFVKVHGETSNYERISSKFSYQLCDCQLWMRIRVPFDFLGMKYERQQPYEIVLIITANCHAHFSSSKGDSEAKCWVRFSLIHFFLSITKNKAHTRRNYDNSENERIFMCVYKSVKWHEDASTQNWKKE